ncbi:MAG: energy transducer TonB [Chitinophagaceae bacterium]|nr:energy transducer TonB [Chitinophagaceae bacterium]
MRTLFILFTLPFYTCLFAQKDNKVSLYVFDGDWKSCKIEQAKYLGCFRKLSDTAYQWKYYRFDGPLMAIETYKDKEGDIPHGKFVFFGPDGKVDSSGNTYDGKKNDWWYYMTDSSTLFRKEKYSQGKLLESMDTTAIRLESEENQRKWDSRVVKDEVEASFDGGEKAWVKYIQKNIEFPDRARNLKKAGMVVIQFIIDKAGNVTEVEVVQSVEYSLDEEAIRLIRQAPKWNPAYKDGHTIKAYRKQPLTFQYPG